jgi:ADP-ribose pyrophosphatase YjhB (NUDIX family)
VIRETIISQIQAIEPHDEIEEDHQAAALSWVASGADLFRIKKPDVPDRHLVAYFVPIDKQSNKLLLQDHLLAKAWLPPGGHVEVDEDPIDTVKRECQEELGLQATFFGEPKPHFITITQVHDDGASHTDVSLWFMVGATEQDQLTLEKNKFKAVQWWSIADILNSPLENFNPEMHRFCKKLLRSIL